MATTTQYNPSPEFNRVLIDAGASKTVYALVVPETETAKAECFGNDGSETRTEFMNQFREAWTSKQDALHRDFFDAWVKWAEPVVALDRNVFPFFYPTAGASEPLRQIIFDFAAHGGRTIHVFAGEYEGYKAMGEAAGLKVVEHVRADWRKEFADTSKLSHVWKWLTGKLWTKRDLFCISQPSGIDGNVWHDFNDFVCAMPYNSVVADVTYVGAVPRSAIRERFWLNALSIRNVVFSLSKPFGCYYDRIGGVFSRTEDAGLFGNKWFKSLTALRIGTILLRNNGVFDLPERYRETQQVLVESISGVLGTTLTASDVYILATGEPKPANGLHQYLTRAGKLRVCLTPGMARLIGTGHDK